MGADLGGSGTTRWPRCAQGTRHRRRDPTLAAAQHAAVQVMITRSELDHIRRRWQAERKVSAKDVDRLIDAAERALTMRAANDLRRTPGQSKFHDLFGTLTFPLPRCTPPSGISAHRPPYATTTSASSFSSRYFAPIQLTLLAACPLVGPRSGWVQCGYIVVPSGTIPTEVEGPESSSRGLRPSSGGDRGRRISPVELVACRTRPALRSCMRPLSRPRHVSAHRP